MRADRLLSLLMLLQARGRVTARELAERLEVSERTIYRDLEALSAAGIPVYGERGPGGGCILLDSYRAGAPLRWGIPALTEAEARALLLAAAPGLVVDLGLRPALERALLKLLTALPASSRGHAERARRRFYLDLTAWYPAEVASPHLQILQQAVWEDRQVLITWDPTQIPRDDERMDPYGLVAKGGAWYLVAAAAGAIQVRPVAWIRTVALAEERFERPVAFDLAAYWTAWCAGLAPSPNRIDRTQATLLALLPHSAREWMRGLISGVGASRKTAHRFTATKKTEIMAVFLPNARPTFAG
jgi:predicted DNA-binding transcriptional regulator YafY